MLPFYQITPPLSLRMFCWELEETDFRTAAILVVLLALARRGSTFFAIRRVFHRRINIFTTMRHVVHKNYPSKDDK